MLVCEWVVHVPTKSTKIEPLRILMLPKNELEYLIFKDLGIFKNDEVEV